MDAYLFLFAALNGVLALASWVSFASGAMNLAVAGFYSMGGYVAALVSTRLLHGQTVWAQVFVSILLALFVSVPVSFAICRLTGKLRGIFFALATLSFLEFFRVLCLNFEFLGGAVGIFGIPPLAANEAVAALFIGLWTCAAFFACLFLKASVLGKSFEMVRLDEFAAQSLGLDVAAVRMQAAVLTCALASITGVFAAHALGTWNSRQGSFDTAVTLVGFAILGGAKSPAGAFVVAVLLSLIPEYLRETGDWRLVLTGATLVAGCVFLPDGISFGRIGSRSVQGKIAHGIAEKAQEAESQVVLARRCNPDQKEPVLKVIDLSVCFGGLHALSRVSLEVRTGEIFGVIGPNGAGKTTLMNALSGFVPIQSGSIWFSSSEISAWPPHKRARLGVGRSFQNLRLLDKLSVLENLCAATLSSHRHNMVRAYRTGQEFEHAFYLLELLKIAHLAHRQAGTLSYGAKRKVEIARALLLKPQLLVLDEPAAGLNTAEKRELSQELLQIVQMGQILGTKRGLGLAESPLTLLVIEHDLPLIESICHRILVLQNGQQIACGATHETLRSDVVQNAYLGKI